MTYLSHGPHNILTTFFSLQSSHRAVWIPNPLSPETCGSEKIRPQLESGASSSPAWPFQFSSTLGQGFSFLFRDEETMSFCGD